MGTYDLTFAIRKGDEFRSKIAFSKGGSRDATWEIGYVDGNHYIPIVPRPWSEAFEGEQVEFNEGLSRLAGKRVRFALVARSQGITNDTASGRDWMNWIDPLIVGAEENEPRPYVESIGLKVP